MSGYLQGLVFKHAHVSGATLLVLLAMADIADDDGTKIFPSLRKLAIKTRGTERTVKRAIKTLEGTKRIKRVAEATGHTGVYAEWEIIIENLLAEPPLWTDPKPRKTRGQNVTRSRPTTRGHLRQDQVTSEAGPGDICDTRIRKTRPLNVLDTSARSPRAPERRGDLALWAKLASTSEPEVVKKLESFGAALAMDGDRVVVDFEKGFAERFVRGQRRRVAQALGRETVFRYAGREGQP